MSLGVTIGRFYPFHRGHDLLITEAKRQVEQLVVLSCATYDQDVADVEANKFAGSLVRRSRKAKGRRFIRLGRAEGNVKRTA